MARFIVSLNGGASPGPDGVIAEHLIYGSSVILFQTIASLLTACLTEMRVPTSFSESTAVPIIKKSGPCNDVDPDCATITGRSLWYPQLA